MSHRGAAARICLTPTRNERLELESCRGGSVRAADVPPQTFSRVAAGRAFDSGHPGEGHRRHVRFADRAASTTPEHFRSVWSHGRWSVTRAITFRQAREVDGAIPRAVAGAHRRRLPPFTLAFSLRSIAPMPPGFLASLDCPLAPWLSRCARFHTNPRRDLQNRSPGEPRLPAVSRGRAWVAHASRVPARASRPGQAKEQALRAPFWGAAGRDARRGTRDACATREPASHGEFREAPAPERRFCNLRRGLVSGSFAAADGAKDRAVHLGRPKRIQALMDKPDRKCS